MSTLGASEDTERERTRTRRSVGFTLTELVVILAVIGLLAGAALPSLSGLSDARGNVAASRVRSALVFAQEWAMASTVSTWVAFDAADETAAVYVEDAANPGKANRVALTDPLSRTAMVVRLGDAGQGIDAVDFGATNEVQFDASGSPFDAGGTPLATDGTVTMAGGAVVRVTRNTGLVTID